MFFRRHASPFPSLQARLRRIEPDGRYRVSTAIGYEPSSIRTVIGEELIELTIDVADRPGSLLLRYSKIDEVCDSTGACVV